MHVLVVNLGSTSLKLRSFDMNDERELARGGVDGVGRDRARVTLQVGGAEPVVSERPIADPAEAIEVCLAGLSGGGGPPPIDAVGFKAVHGGPLPDAVVVTEEVLAVMEAFAGAAPAHNPVYVAAMRAFAQRLPTVPLVAAFETGFHTTIPEARQTYAIPYEWTSAHGIRRYGFHGASHRWVATRAAQLLGRTDLKVVSCHLGGSSSLCAIDGGRSVANSFGMTPQSGLPQNNRVGEFDPYALLPLRSATGKSFDELLATAAREGGLRGISGVSNAAEEILAAAAEGNERARLAIDVLVESIRHHLGAYLVALGGLDVLTFTGGIGENSAEIRRRVCAGLEFLGIALDPTRNETAGDEGDVATAESAVRILVMHTNEELIVARQTRDLLERRD